MTCFLCTVKTQHREAPTWALRDSRTQAVLNHASRARSKVPGKTSRLPEWTLCGRRLWKWPSGLVCARHSFTTGKTDYEPIHLSSIRGKLRHQDRPDIRHCREFWDCLPRLPAKKTWLEHTQRAGMLNMKTGPVKRIPSARAEQLPAPAPLRVRTCYSASGTCQPQNRFNKHLWDE